MQQLKCATTSNRCLINGNNSIKDPFPIEIYESIVDFVAEEDDSLLSSLKICALVSHNFLSLARNHIFGSVQLNSCSNSQNGRPIAFLTTSMFTQLISRNHEIAQHVRTFIYYVPWENLVTEGLRLREVLKLLNNLRSITIFPQSFRPLIWSDVPWPLREVFLHLLRLPMLGCLTLAFIRGFILSDLSLCSNLVYLKTRDVRLYIAPSDMTEQEKALRLQEYSLVTSNGDSSSHLSSGRQGEFAICFCGKNVYDPDRSEDQQDEAKKMLQQCMQLMDIGVHVCDFRGAPEQIKGYSDVILPLLQTLQRLYISLYAHQGDGDPLCGLAAELQAIAGKNVIEVIQINVKFQRDQNSHDGDEWAALDRAFTDHQLGWRNLKDFYLIIAVGSNVRNDGKLVKTLKTLPENQLKGLAESKDWLFDFEFSR